MGVEYLTEKRVFEGYAADLGNGRWQIECMGELGNVYSSDFLAGLDGKRIRMIIEPLPVAHEPAAQAPEKEHGSLMDIVGMLSDYVPEQCKKCKGMYICIRPECDVLRKRCGKWPDDYKAPAPGPDADDSNGGGA